MLVEERDHVGAVLRVAEAGEGHLGARRERLRAGQPLREIVPVPVAALPRQRVGESEALALADRLAEHAPQVGPELRWRRPCRHCGRRAHFLKTSAPLAGVGLGEIDFDRLLGRRAAFALLRDALDRIAHLFRALAVERLAGDDRGAERDDACEQHPAGDGVEAIVHEVSLFSRRPRRMDLRRLLRGEFELLQAAARASSQLASASSRGAAIERRQARFGEAVDRLPPAFADRLGAALDRKVEREMGEDVADRAERSAPASAARRSTRCPGSAAMPPSRPLAGRRTSQTWPSRSIH